MDKDFVDVRVHGVFAAPGEGAPLVLLVDGEGEAGLPVPVGPFEASAIIIELEGISPPRPLTHDLLADIFRESGLLLERAELYGDPEGVARLEHGASAPLARLVYRRGLRRAAREVRPSDAIALALRLRAPILAERRLLGSRAEAEAAIRLFSPGPEPFYLRTSPR